MVLVPGSEARPIIDHLHFFLILRFGSCPRLIRPLKRNSIVASVTRLGDLLDFGQLNRSIGIPLGTCVALGPSTFWTIDDSVVIVPFLQLIQLLCCY